MRSANWTASSSHRRWKVSQLTAFTAPLIELRGPKRSELFPVHRFRYAPASCINTEYFSLYLAIFASYPLTRKTLWKLLFKSFQKAQIRRVHHFKRTVYQTEARCVGETITLSAKIINSFVAGIFLITYPKESKNTLSTWRIMKNYDKS